jgi:DNA-binding protein H-NS
MTKSYSTVLKQIEALKVEAEKLRRNEVDGVIARIREAIQHYGLSAADLGLGGAKAKAAPAEKAAMPGKRKKRKTAAAKTPAVAKFSDGQGNTWVGRGKRPQWLRDALAAGKTLADFEIK